MNAELGARIRDLRVERGLTQRELAEPRYSRGFLAAVESGHRVPTDEVLAYVAHRLGHDAEDLRHGRPSGLAQTLSAKLEEAFRRLSCGDDTYAEQTADAVIAQAQRFHLPELVCRGYQCQGEVYLHRGDPGAALFVLRQAEAAGPSGALAAENTRRTSLALFLTGQTSASVEIVESALHTLRAAPPVDPEAQLRLLTALIYPYIEIGAVERARRVADEGLALVSRVSNREAVAFFYAVVSQVCDAEGRLSEVDSLLASARQIFSELGLERDIGRCHWMRGYVLLRLDRLDEAGTELAQAREIFTAVGARHFHSGATNELAEVRRRQGRLDEAEALCGEAAEDLAVTGYAEGIAEIDRLRGRIAIARGDLVAAERLLNRAVDRYAGAGLFNELMRTCRELGDLLSEQERLAEAVDVMQRGLAAVAKID